MSDPVDQLKEAVVEALNTVVDPCGLFNGSRTTIGELGMYRDITISPEKVEIEVFLDDPSCAFSGQIMIGIQEAVAPVIGKRSVEMSLVVDDYWDEHRVTAAGRRKLEHARLQRRKMIPLNVIAAHSRTS